MTFKNTSHTLKQMNLWKKSEIVSFNSFSSSISRISHPNVYSNHPSIISFKREYSIFSRNSKPDLSFQQNFSQQSKFLFSSQKRSLHIVELTEDNIDEELFNSKIPMIIKFEANWCGPCQILSPIMKSSLQQYANDKVKLITVNVDSPIGQALSQKFYVTSIPMVVALRPNKSVIHHFTGALPKEELDKWIQEVVKDIDSEQDAEVKEKSVEGKSEEDAWLPSEALAEGNKLLAENDFDGAMKFFGKVVQDSTAEAFHPLALVGMARVSLKVGKLEDAKTCVDNIPSSAFDNEEVRSIASLVKLVEEATSINKTLEELQKEIEQDPNNLLSQYQLSLFYAARENYEESINLALNIVKKDKSWENGKAKDFLLSLFNVLGPNNPLSKKSRARLANALF